MNKPRARHPGLLRAGFTAIEIVAALVIIGIVAVVATAALDSGDFDPQIEADTLKSTLRYAQLNAMKDIYPWEVQIYSTTYQLRKHTNDSGTTEVVPLPGSSENNRTMPNGVTLGGTLGTYAFDYRGQPYLDGTDSSDLLTSDSTITVTRGGHIVSLTITKNTGYIP